MKRRVLYLIDCLGHGGAEHQLVLTVGALDRQRFESFVCFLHPQDYLSDHIRQQGVPVYGLGLPSGKPHWPRAVWKVRRLVRSLRIDLIHTSLFESDVIGGIVGRLCRVPVVSTLCNVGSEPERLVDNPFQGPLKLAFGNGLWGLVLRHCQSHCIAISQAVKASSMRSYRLGEDRLTVVYRALPDTWYSEVRRERVVALRDSLGLGGAFPVLLNVGRLMPQKGQRYLIEAMPPVVERFPMARLLIVGLGPLLGPLRSLSQALGVDRHVHFLGRREDVRDLLEACDIFVFPSLFEGLGVALLEAAGTGRPCVASRVGPLPEVIEDGVSGLLVEPASPPALSEAIVRLASGPDMARATGQRAREQVHSRFRVQRMASDLASVYEAVLEGKGSPRDARASGTL